MSVADSTAIAAARSRWNLTRSHLEEDTQFIDRLLQWAIEERASSRLAVGMPVTLVKFDFAAPASARLGPEVRLNNAEAQLGAIHLSNPTLKSVRVDGGPGALATVSAHQEALKERQLLNTTSVTIDPVSGTAYVRAECAPTVEPMPIRLAAVPHPAWPGTGLQPLDSEIRSFHQTLGFVSTVAPLLIEPNGPRQEMRIIYRDAIYLHLAYQVGLRAEHGYKLVPGLRELRVVHAGSQAEVLISAVGTRSSNPAHAQRIIKRLVSAVPNSNGKPVSVSCMACPSMVGDEADCGSPPIRLFHRHLDAA